MRSTALQWGSAVVCALTLLARPAGAATIAVPAGGSFQAALNAARPGDIITLAPGAVYTGNFTLPNKGAVGDYITIRSAAPDSALPPVGVRMTPAYAAQLPKIKSSNSAGSLRTSGASNHYRLMFLEFQANSGGYGDIIDLGWGDSTQTQLSQVPYALILDRVYVHGDPVLGQKRGIALNSSDTIIINSYISDCKAVGQDAQAIGGWNGPGNYRIENNYLEGAGENFLLGGGDPTIPNLVTTNVIFRKNYLSRPVAWRDPIIATPAAVSATAAIGAGSLPAGTYAYKVVARVPAGQTTKANSAPSTEVLATLTTDGGVTITWTPVVGAADYVVYGRSAGAENVYWTTTNAYFSDTGTAGTAGAPASKGTKWTVKNAFELKNAQDVLVEGNVFENVWVGDQSGYPIVFTPRNQNGTAPWTVVQRVTFQYNLVRHAAGGVTTIGVDNNAPSQLTNHLTIRNNVFDDITGSRWGTGSRPFQLGNGGDSFTIDHNTIVSTDSSVIYMFGGPPTPITNVVITNNMAAHNAYGIMGGSYSSGMPTITAYLPGSVVAANVLAGGSTSKYPAGNFFPTVAAWQSGFVGYATGDYRLISTSPYKYAGTDGADLGANVDLVNAATADALSGSNTISPGGAPVRIVTTSLPNGTYQQPYAQLLACSGASGTCAWQLVDSSLPAGVTFDPVAGAIVGTPTQISTDLVTVMAFDTAWPANFTTATLSLTIDPPPFVEILWNSGTGQMGQPFQAAATATGAIGTVTFSVVSGSLPAGVTLDGQSGAIGGVPSTWGTTTAVVQAQDSWRIDRVDAKSLTVTVAPAPLAITSAAGMLPIGSVRQPYQTNLATIGGTGSAVWLLVGGALPPGLTLASNGSISGTPTAVGTFAFTVQAEDAGWPGNVTSSALSINIGAREVVLYATDATTVAGRWSLVADPTAAGGVRIASADLGGPKLNTPLASPANYFEIDFQAEAGVAYHLWVRGKADKNYWGNDSVMAQFSGSTDATGVPKYRIGTVAALDINLEDCSGCGLTGWGWQDNGWGINVFGPNVYFDRAGTQTIRVQVKEDGFSIDQVVMSGARYVATSPGALKNDMTILAR